MTHKSGAEAFLEANSNKVRAVLTLTSLRHLLHSTKVGGGGGITGAKNACSTSPARLDH